MAFQLFWKKSTRIEPACGFGGLGEGGGRQKRSVWLFRPELTFAVSFLVFCLLLLLGVCLSPAFSDSFEMFLC